MHDVKPAECTSWDHDPTVVRHHASHIAMDAYLIDRGDCKRQGSPKYQCNHQTVASDKPKTVLLTLYHVYISFHNGFRVKSPAPHRNRNGHGIGFPSSSEDAGNSIWQSRAKRVWLAKLDDTGTLSLPSGTVQQYCRQGIPGCRPQHPGAYVVGKISASRLP